MRVKHETAIRAFVSFDGINVSLTSINSEGTATTSDLAITTYKILSTLQTAIEALGWTVELSNSSYATEPTLLLRPIFAQDALSPSTADLYLADMYEGVKLINQDMIERTDDGYFPVGSNNIFVWYKAGYTLPTDESDGTLPAGLLLIVHQLLNDVLSTRDKTGEFQSESLGDYSYSRGQIVSAIQNRKKDLDYYRRVTI